MGALDESALAALPIFPLPDVVLFPGALLPLHVFEPRYRELTADVLAGSKIMAVSRLRPGFEKDYHGRPPVFDTIGAGYVVAHELLDDGRYNILLRGVARVQVELELPNDRAYRRIRGHVLLDTRSRRPEILDERQRELIAMCDRLSLAMEEGGAQLRELARAVPSPGGCADVLSAALVLDPDARQLLFETTDPADRLDVVTEHVATLLTRMATPGTGQPN